MGRREAPGWWYGLPSRGGEAVALAIVTPDGAVPAWLATSLARAEEAGLATVRAVVGDFDPAGAAPATKGAAVAARVTGRARGLGQRVGIDAPRWPVRGAEAAADAARSAGATIALWAPSTRVVPVALDGIETWALRFGRWGWSPIGAGLPERVGADDVVSVSLVILGGGPGGDEEPPILRTATVGLVLGSLGRTADRALVAAGTLAFDALADRARGTRAPVPAIEPVHEARRSTVAAAGRASVLAARAKGRDKLFGAALAKHWSIGVATATAADVVAGRLGPIRWMAGQSPDDDLADPMIVPGTERLTVLCERFAPHQRGTIVRLVIEVAPDAPRLVDQQVIVDEPHHLSYPLIVPTADGLLCAPEAGESGRWAGYPLDGAGAVVGPPIVLLDDFDMIDPSLFEHEGRWWLAGTRLDDGPDTRLWLFHAPSSTGPWTPHAANPVLTDSRIARGAGAPFRHEGHWYRLAQDCAVGYGLGVHVLRIDELTPTTFREAPVATFRPSLAGPGWVGLHTLAVGDGIVVLDGYRNVVNLAAGWKRVRAKLPIGRGGR